LLFFGVCGLGGVEGMVWGGGGGWGGVGGGGGGGGRCPNYPEIRTTEREVFGISYIKQSLLRAKLKHLKAEMLYLRVQSSSSSSSSSNNNNNNNNNKQGIIIPNNERGKHKLIGVAISGDKNMTKKEVVKTIRYKYLTIEIKHMRNMKAKMIPVTTGATGTI